MKALTRQDKRKVVEPTDAIVKIEDGCIRVVLDPAAGLTP